jgi:hypothetical protein
MLALRFPHTVFRSGNAEGTDHAFSEGALVDASRLRIVVPYRKHRYPDATYDGPNSVPRVRKVQSACPARSRSPRVHNSISALSRSN